MNRWTRLRSLAAAIDPLRAPALAERFAAWGPERAEAASLAQVVVAAYPAFGAVAEARPEAFAAVAKEGWRAPRDRAGLVARLSAAVAGGRDGAEVRRGLRLAVEREKLRIALRELLPPEHGGADIDVTARELSDLAEAAIEVALSEAQAHVAAQMGAPRASSGEPSTFVVLGMGKLGGRELNAGSDIDLLYLYDTDDGGSGPAADGDAHTLQEHWSRVARRLTATLDEPTAEGIVWRVDLRLRPEGSRGAIANSVPAAERYYETFGRLWERAALLRARPVAGDLALGASALAELAPFVYRRHVDPSIAAEMQKLSVRARTELSPDPARDLKLGPGGIRDAEFFVQSLQLVWGGREPRVQETNTLGALRRLRSRGLVTDREGREVADAYVLFRRLEHRVQWATGLQTHLMPSSDEDLDRLARSLGWPGREPLLRDLDKTRARIAARFASLAPTAGAAEEPSRWAALLGRLDHPEEPGLDEAVSRAFGPLATPELVHEIRQLARRPEDLLGGGTRERWPELAPTFLEALVDAADPEQAARFVRTFLARFEVGLYTRPLAEDPRALRRLVAALGASALVGQQVAQRPELADQVLFGRGTPTPESAGQDVETEFAELPAADRDDPDAFVGALRRAQGRVSIEVALSDLSGEIGTRESTLVLSALADAILERAVRFALGSEGPVKGLAVVAMGKLGGNEIGFGSDLDVIFVFDPAAAPPGADPHEHFARRAQRVIRLVSAPHAEGRGYELDTRLRPSGSQGMLVTSLASFARYHDVRLPELGPPPESAPAVSSGSAAWERLALVRARFAAGDADLGRSVMRVAHAAAYEHGAPPVADMHRLRTRMERELARERPGRHDLKLGRGGLTDIEFAMQLLQMRHGADPRVRTSETANAIDALEALGHLAPSDAAPLREGYQFLRKLEQRIRIVHGSSAHLLDERAEGLAQLARRMGLRDGPTGPAAAQLVARYRDVTEAVRKAYLDVLDLGPE